MFVFLAIIGLGVLVFFHELGHFLMAKILGIKVEEFGFGYPPRICGFIWKRRSKLGFFLKYRFASVLHFFKKDELFSRVKFFWGKNIPSQIEKRTIYSLNWIPFGGFNKLKGELDGLEDKDSFFSQVWWKKVLIGLGGVAMNIVLAIFIFAFLYSTGIPQDIDSIRESGRVLRPVGIQIGMIAPNSPADKQGLKMGDIIVSLDGRSFEQVQEIQDYIKAKIGQSVEIEVKRAQQNVSLRVEVLPYHQVFSSDNGDYGLSGQTPAEQSENNPVVEDSERGVIGITLSKTAIVAYPWYQSVLMAIEAAVLLLGRLFYGIWLILKTLLIKRKMLGEFFGPVGITVVTAQVARLGYVYFLQFVAFLSVAIGAFQVVPFPSLDGSRVLFAIIQGVRGKPVNYRIEGIIINAGFCLLLLLLALITFREVFGLF